MLNSIIFFSIVVFTNFFIFYFYKSIVNIYNLYDKPDFERKLHKKKIPLLGGLFLSINLLLILFLSFIYPEILDNNFFNNVKHYFSFFFISILFYFLGFFDDKYKLSPNFKLIAMIIFLSFALFLDEDILLKNLNFFYFDYSLNLSNYSYFFTIFCFLLFINAFNMLDGINGQAPSYFLFIMLLFLSKAILVYLVFVFLVYVLFFLGLNFKNKTFLGDSGALPLAFITSFLFIKSYNLGHNFSVEEIFLVMSVPGYELLRLAISRLLNKKHPFEADNLHLHHLIFAKKKFLKTFLIIQFLLISPYILLKLSNSFLLSLFVNLFMYVAFVFFFKKFAAKKKLIN
jgi:UDP-N-acetylmuramyl pentapeptide phosphotransferase/UDP-N-acetylglucosamine-1-phosphate transferase